MKLTYNEILKACINGIKTSFKEYEKWSGGEWLWNGPEYLITVNIAKAIDKIDKPKFITLEDNITQTLKNANAKIKGCLKKKIRPNGRSDIVLWWGKGSPRGIIEVKNAIFRIEEIIKDVNRIIGILEKESDMELGIIAFYIDRHYEKKDPVKQLQKRINNIFEKLKTIANNNGLKYKHLYEIITKTKNDAAFGGAFMFYK